MNAGFAEFFIARWRKHFADAGLPICAFYPNEVREADVRESASEHRCLIGNLNRVREGFPFVYDARTPGCPGGKRYSGFSRTLRPNFEYFLSCGIPGKMEGERYKKTPELVQAYLRQHPPFELGYFDVSARPHAPANTLAFAMPIGRLEQMARNIDESFLVAASWQAVRDRLG